MDASKIAEIIETLERAKDNGLDYVWSGDLGRNQHLRDCFNYGDKQKIFDAIPVESEQESGYKIVWADWFNSEDKTPKQTKHKRCWHCIGIIRGKHVTTEWQGHKRELHKSCHKELESISAREDTNFGLTH